MNKLEKQKAKQGRLSQALKDNLKRRKQQPHVKIEKNSPALQGLKTEKEAEKEADAPITTCE